jgi:hypothetical protein
MTGNVQVGLFCRTTLPHEIIDEFPFNRNSDSDCFAPVIVLEHQQTDRSDRKMHTTYTGLLDVKLISSMRPTWGQWSMQQRENKGND